MHLSNTADAEDAYQITFMALAGRAHKICVKDTLARSWLCQVARRSSLNSRKADKSRKKLQANLQSQCHSDAPPKKVRLNKTN